MSAANRERRFRNDAAQVEPGLRVEVDERLVYLCWFEAAWQSHGRASRETTALTLAMARFRQVLRRQEAGS